MASPGQAAQDMPAPAIKQALAGPWNTGHQAYGDRRAFLEQIASLAAENGLTAEEALARCKAALRSASDVESTASADSDLELATPVQRPTRHGFVSPTPSPAGQPEKQQRPVCYSITKWCKSARSRQSSTVHSRAAHSMPCSTQYAEQTEQHAACHAAHSIMQSRHSSTVHSRAVHSMPCSTQHAEQTEQHAACHAAHSIMQSSMQHIISMQSARSSSAESLGTELASPASEHAMVPLCGDEQAVAALPRGGAALKAAQAAEEEALAEKLKLLPAESSQLVQRPALRSQRQRGGRPKKAAGLQKCRYLGPLAAKA